MDDRLTQLEARLARLAGTVEALEGRLEALERRPDAGAPAPEPEGPGADAEAPASAAGRPDLVTLLSLVGRSFIVLGGGFLLRALTEAGTLPPLAGVILGLAYAAVSIVAADRAAAAGRPWSANFHAATAVLVGFPLIWEASTRFQVLSPPASALVLALSVAAPMALAWRRRLQAPAWIATFGALIAAIALIAATGQVMPFALLLIALGTFTLWVGYSLDWVGLRWPVAAVADVVVSALTLRALAPDPLDSAAVTLGVQVLLVAAYLGSIGVRTLVRKRNVVPFEVVQTAAVLVVGFGGAVSVTRATGASVSLVGWVFLAFGIASYAVAVRFLDPKLPLRRNVYYYSSIALVFILTGCELLWTTGAVAVIWTALAVAGCVLWSRLARFFLLIHGAVYLVAAGIATGAFGYGIGVIVGAPPAPWETPAWHLFVLLAGAAACAWWAAADDNVEMRRPARTPRLLIVLTLVWAAGGVVIGTIAPAIAGTGDGSLETGILATVRTSVLSIAALGIAWVGRHGRFVEWSWLVYPLLVAIGLKMIARDFAASRPATLFVALALYGIALILAPRLRRARPDPPPAA